jgi:hypothetical protein
MLALNFNVRTTFVLKGYFFALNRPTWEPCCRRKHTCRTFTTCLHTIIYEHVVTCYPAHNASRGAEHCRLSPLFSSQCHSLFVLVSISKWWLSPTCHFFCRPAGKTGGTEKNVPRQGVRSPMVNICTKCPNIKILWSLPPRDIYLFISYYFHDKQRIFSYLGLTCGFL